MIATLKKIAAAKAARENNEGFTLIELLIVIVVLGILAGVVVFSLGSVTGSSAIAACQADGAELNTGIQAYNAATGSYPSTLSALVPSYLTSVPPTTGGHFAFTTDGNGGLLVGKTLATATTAWAGASSCSSSTVA